MSEYKRLTHDESIYCEMECGQCSKSDNIKTIDGCYDKRIYARLKRYEQSGSLEEFAKLAKAKEYGNREFCKSIDCTAQKLIDNGNERYKDFCRQQCDAYKFHDWLQKNGYRIIRLPELEGVNGSD